MGEETWDELQERREREAQAAERKRLEIPDECASCGQRGSTEDFCPNCKDCRGCCFCVGTIHNENF